MRAASSIARGSSRGSPRLALAFAALLAASLPAAAQTESVLQNVRFGGESISYEAPRLIVRGSRLSQAELTRLLDPASPQPWGERLTALEAEEILAPELNAVVKLPQMEQRTVYRDVSFKRISGGKIGSATASGGTLEGQQQGRKITGTNGALSIQDIDMAGAVALLTAKAGPAEPMRRLYGNFSMEGMRIVDSLGVTTEIGRMSGSGFSAKPTAAGWMETINALAAAGADKNSPAAMRTTFGAMSEIFDSIAIGSTEVADISMKGRVEKDNVDLNVAIKKVAFTGAEAGRGAEFKIEGADFAAGGAHIRYGTMALGGLDAKAAMEVFRELGLNPQNPSPAVLRRLLPMISTIRIDDVDVDVPADPSKSASLAADSERTRFGLGRFEIAAEKPINGIPTDLRIVLRNVGAALPANSPNAGVATLTQLGYDRVDGSFGINLTWNELGQEIVVRDISLDGKDMGTATLRGVIGRVSRDVFDVDTAVASVALLGASAKAIELTVENRGLFERIVAREAQRQKRPAEDVRREYGMAASVGIPAILGNGAAAKALAQAVARFVAKPGKLVVQARAKQQSGFGVADYMANPTPAGVLESIDLTASAE